MALFLELFVGPGLWHEGGAALREAPAHRQNTDLLSQSVGSDAGPSPAEGELAGRVVDELGAPVAGARIELAIRSRAGESLVPQGELGVMAGPIPYPPDLGTQVLRNALVAAPLPIARKVTDSSGRFSIAKIIEGDYELIAEREDLVPAREAIRVLSASRSEIALVMRKGWVVEGRVVDMSGAPIRHADVQVLGVNQRVSLSSITGDDGSYRLGRVAKDSRIMASAPGFLTRERELLMPVGSHIDRLLVDFTLVAIGGNAAISGRVLDQLGRPVALAEVTAVLAPLQADMKSHGTELDRVHSVRSGSDGRFVLGGLTDDDRSFRIAIKGDGFVVASLEGIRAGEDDVLIRLLPGGGIQGEVRSAHTNALVGAFELEARGPGDALVSRHFGNGEFKLTALAPGEWTLAFRARGFAASVQVVSVPEARERDEVTVRGMRIEMTRGAVVQGVVYDARGNPVPGARVECGEVRGTTDGHGRFRLLDLEPIDTQIRASHPEWGGGHEAVSLRSGDELSTVEIRLDGEVE